VTSVPTLLPEIHLEGGWLSALKWTAFDPKGTVPIATPSPDTPGGRDHLGRLPPKSRSAVS
jgi:hypothetical protein